MARGVWQVRKGWRLLRVCRCTRGLSTSLMWTWLRYCWARLRNKIRKIRMICWRRIPWWCWRSMRKRIKTNKTVMSTMVRKVSTILTFMTVLTIAQKTRRCSSKNWSLCQMMMPTHWWVCSQSWRFWSVHCLEKHLHELKLNQRFVFEQWQLLKAVPTKDSVQLLFILQLELVYEQGL